MCLNAYCRHTYYYTVALLCKRWPGSDTESRVCPICAGESANQTPRTIGGPRWGGISSRSTRAGIDYSFKRKSAKPVIKSNACRAGLTVAYRCGWLLHEKEQQSGPSRYELFYRASYRLRPKIRPRALSISTRSNVPARSANRLFLNFPRAKIDTSVKRASAVNKQRTKFLSRRIARRV